MMRTWYQFTVKFYHKDNQLIDKIVSIFDAYYSLGSEVKYAFDYYENHENLFGEIPEEIPDSIRQKPCEIISYFESQENFSVLEEEIASLFNEVDFQVETEIIEEENWQENWMAYYQPEHLSHFLTVLPIWIEDYQPHVQEQIIKLDPGVAFGTGNHPSSRLAAQALEMIMRGGEKVIDVGCGTGILSFVAAILGASQVQAFDLDPQAVDAARQNLTYQDHPAILELNNSQKINFEINDLLQGIEKPVDIIIANILPHILIELFQDASRLINKGGYLILGGILNEKADFIEEKMEDYPFERIYKIQSNQWMSYIYQRRGRD